MIAKVHGKLLNLFQLLSRYNVHAAAYIQRLQGIQHSSKRSHVNFLSPLNQNRLINVMASYITEVISNRIKQQGRFSIISDSTQDVSKKEILHCLLDTLKLVNMVNMPSWATKRSWLSAVRRYFFEPWSSPRAELWWCRKHARPAKWLTSQSTTAQSKGSLWGAIHTP